MGRDYTQLAWLRLRSGEKTATARQLGYIEQEALCLGQNLRLLIP
jgi:hypothetical protein